MKIAVLSDIHANLEAFRAVLADLDTVRPDRIVSLGDNIGYGPDPEEVIRLLWERDIPSVMGNHELAIVRPAYQSWFNPSARLSIQITGDLLSIESIEYIRRLSPFLADEGGLFVHGCPPDSITRYIFEVPDRELVFHLSAMEQTVSFVGHTHELETLCFDGKDILRSPLKKGILQMEAAHRYVLNIGSVGQPRDGNNNAKYAVWDTSVHSVEMRFVAYDIQRTVDRIIRLGLPRVNAERLW